MHGFIRSALAETHGAETANAVRILYAGSVKPDIIATLMSQPDVGGARVGGAMACTFFKAQGFTIGKSLVEDDMMPMALEIEQMAKAAGVDLLLPTDHQVVDSYDPINSRKAIQIDFTNAGYRLSGVDALDEK